MLDRLNLMKILVGEEGILSRLYYSLQQYLV